MWHNKAPKANKKSISYFSISFWERGKRIFIDRGAKGARLPTEAGEIENGKIIAISRVEHLHAEAIDSSSED
jgi:hypothetical protein